ncbi:MAG: hypothetical protein A2293_15920 [Elusimicrobia bacterium RIFOXYB2_FULL_49_7]|nr:MAG: hypothetical protein A2293_15920 [Elusimicrobia bacterium RIFOXYB2_FULL_49_7]
MVIGFVVLLTFLFLFGGSYGVIRLLRLKIEKRRLMADIRTLEHKQDSLKQTIERIQKDPAEIERIAREHYGMAKPGEKVFKFVSPAERKSNPAKPE